MSEQVTERELDVRRTWFALVLAELDGDPDAVAVLLDRPEDPGFGVDLARWSARAAVRGADGNPVLRAEFRAELVAALRDLAAAAAVTTES